MVRKANLVNTTDVCYGAEESTLIIDRVHSCREGQNAPTIQKKLDCTSDRLIKVHSRPFAISKLKMPKGSAETPVEALVGAANHSRLSCYA
jgi:hypothetical protein